MSLDPDQVGCYVGPDRNLGPDLVPNCLQSYQQTKLVGKELTL